MKLLFNEKITTSRQTAGGIKYAFLEKKFKVTNTNDTPRKTDGQLSSF